MSKIQLILTIVAAGAFVRYAEHLPVWVILFNATVIGWNTTSLLFKLKD
jgi:hypothetical protein